MASLINSKRGFQSAAAAITGTEDPNAMRQVDMRQLIDEHYGDLPESEKELIRDTLSTRMAVGCSGGLVDEKDLPEDAKFHEGNSPSDTPNNSADDKAKVVDTTPETGGDAAGASDNSAGSSAGNQFMKLGDKFVNIDNLSVDLISEINPFQGAYEILSKSLTPQVLRQVQNTVTRGRSKMTEEEAIALWPRINAFLKENGREPDANSDDHIEVHYAHALAFLRERKREQLRAKAEGAS